MTDGGGASQPAARSHPNTRPCDDCGHVWFAGERRHEYLDDEERGEARVLCVLCRRQRALARADE